MRDLSGLFFLGSALIAAFVGRGGKDERSSYGGMPRSRSKVRLADGEYEGHWSGYQVDLDNGETIPTEVGCKCMLPGPRVHVVVKNGIATIDEKRASFGRQPPAYHSPPIEKTPWGPAMIVTESNPEGSWSFAVVRGPAGEWPIIEATPEGIQRIYADKKAGVRFKCGSDLPWDQIIVHPSLAQALEMSGLRRERFGYVPPEQGRIPRNEWSNYSAGLMMLALDEKHPGSMEWAEAKVGHYHFPKENEDHPPFDMSHMEQAFHGWFETDSAIVLQSAMKMAKSHGIDVEMHRINDRRTRVDLYEPIAENRYGAVARSMGGRGSRAGAGVDTELGGRAMALDAYSTREMYDTHEGEDFGAVSGARLPPDPMTWPRVDPKSEVRVLSHVSPAGTVARVVFPGADGSLPEVVVDPSAGPPGLMYISIDPFSQGGFKLIYEDTVEAAVEIIEDEPGLLSTEGKTTQFVYYDPRRVPVEVLTKRTVRTEPRAWWDVL